MVEGVVLLARQTAADMNHRPTTKKLNLKRETLRVLSPVELSLVTGGGRGTLPRTYVCTTRS